MSTSILAREGEQAVRAALARLDVAVGFDRDIDAVEFDALALGLAAALFVRLELGEFASSAAAVDHFALLDDAQVLARLDILELEDIRVLLHVPARPLSLPALMATVLLVLRLRVQVLVVRRLDQHHVGLAEPEQQTDARIVGVFVFGQCTHMYALPFANEASAIAIVGRFLSGKTELTKGCCET